MSWRLLKVLRLAGLSLTVVTVGGMIGGSVAPAAPRQGQVRLGPSPLAEQNASVIGSLASDVSIHLSVVLKSRDPAGVASLAREVATPSSPFFHDYLTPTEFGIRFGATDQQLQAVRASLEAHGLKPGPVPVDRLSVPVSATAGQIEQAFSIRFDRIRLADGRQAVAANSAPALDQSVAGYVQAVVGLTSVAAPEPLLQRPALLRGAARSRETAHVQTGGPQPCAAASSAASQEGAYTADQIASAYGFSGMYRAGDEGQGVTIAVYELEPDDPNDIAAYQSCYGTNASISYVPVDGGAGTGEGSGEAALDIEDALGLAPKATYLVYQGPNSDQSTPGSGPYDTFKAIIDQDRAQVITASWGECEQLEGSSGAAAESSLFEQAAIEGQSILSAAGDEGSEDCNDSEDNLPDTDLAVDDPGSQPFVTAVGGTSMTAIGPPPIQAVWNNGGNPSALTGLQGGAGGGGISALWSMPGYQSLAASSLHVINSYSTGSPCGASSGDCREVPDVSADADPDTGYIVYWNGSGSDPTEPSGWQAVGGTSASAPVWAAVLALIDASSSCHGSAVGFANPALYRAAASTYGQGIDDVTSGNNDFTGTNGGRYPAAAGYDMASGLGTPNVSDLDQDLCSDVLRVRNPGAQASVLGKAVSLQMRTSGPVSGAVSYVAAGLPSGLSISRSSGQITGTPNAIGHYVALVVALDGSMAIRGTAFQWTIERAPTLQGVSLSGAGASRPTLRFTVQAGVGEAGLEKLVIGVPGGLRFARSSAVKVTAGGHRLRFRASARGKRLTLTLRSAVKQVTVTISYPSLLTGGGFAANARAGHTGQLALTVTVTDAGHLRTRLKAGFRPRR